MLSGFSDHVTQSLKALVFQERDQRHQGFSCGTRITESGVPEIVGYRDVESLAERIERMRFGYAEDDG